MTWLHGLPTFYQRISTGVENAEKSFETQSLKCGVGDVKNLFGVATLPFPENCELRRSDGKGVP